MAQLFPDVLPGDLITADEMNQILHAINSLNDRVSALEGSVIGGSGVVITDMIPPSGTVTVGDQMTVFGRNFGFSVGSHRVYVDDLRVTAFKAGSSDTQLIFDIPLSIVDVPPEGRSAMLTVSNASSSAQRTLLLKSALVLTGSVDVISKGVTPTTIAAGQPATFSFSLRSRANLDARFAINATISVAANQSEWQNNVQILDSSQAVLANKQIDVPAGQEVAFSVRIGPVPAGTDGVPFTLRVEAVAGNVTGSSGDIMQTVGQVADQPDNTITLNFSSSRVQGTGAVTATEIRLSSGSSAKVSLNATFTVVGSYDLTPSLLGGATNWQAQPLLSTTPNPFPITQQDLSNPQGISAQTLDFVVTPQAGATSGQIEFKVQRQGSTKSRKFTMTLTAL